MSTELELKLLVDSADIPKLRRHALLKTQADGPRRQNLLSIYFDTSELALKQRRMALRVRRVGMRWIQTVKAGGEVHGGLHRRGEWEEPVARGCPDLTKIQEPALSEVFFSPEVRDALQAVFTTEFRRTTWLLRWDDGDEVELALDQGEVKSGERALPISEVELELKQGNPARLYQLALDLQQTIPLRLENVSKAARGYQLFQGTPQPMVKAVAPRIVEAMSVGEAFQTIAWNCIGHWTANQEGVLAGKDPEYLHQMRVALRRLRSALPLFTSAIPRESAAAISAELKWLAGALGPARNWDVFATETCPRCWRNFPTTTVWRNCTGRPRRRGKRQIPARARPCFRHVISVCC
jgi:triphosphatase